ncbi:hypothetical protein [Candidatus Symbiopectobacterium sp.]|uniref:hypothetical protein n=1 Tax=Candidatus Symbiopectobacterium sp. TaxID=2816440 RepID=UPI0025C3DC54|nr:hypothetical protein [Candidatus Symbiopectobacterium sp.]
MLNPERGDASRSDQHFNPKQACHNSIIPYYSTKPSFGRKCLSPQVYSFLMRPNCMILRCDDPSFHWTASIKSIYSTKPLKC